MRRLDRLILRELFGPWTFGVALFTVLLIAGTYLGRITDYIVQGVPPMQVGRIVILLLPAILVKTFAMATLLASLLGFGRLSSDSEVTALRAAGASLWRLMVPVILFSLATAIVAFTLNERVVPSSAKQSTAIAKELASSIKSKSVQPISQPQYEDGKLKALISAKNFSLADRMLETVVMTIYNKDEQPLYVMLANRLRFQSKNDWRIEGGATILAADPDSKEGGMVMRAEEVWPTGVPMINATPEQLAASSVNDPDFNSMAELRDQINRARQDKTLSPEQIRNREFWYWNKIALPLAALMFGVLGAALGIRSARTGAATGFALAIAILFGYLMLTNFTSVWAMGGLIPSWVASFGPIIVGLGVAAIVVTKRNR